MSADRTPPAEAIEAAADRIKCRGCGSDPGQGCRGLNRTTFHPQRVVDARAALIAARPVLVADALAEIEQSIRARRDGHNFDEPWDLGYKVGLRDALEDITRTEATRRE